MKKSIDQRSRQLNLLRECSAERKRKSSHVDGVLVNDSEVLDWLLIEILRRLPVKSVFKFKSVSKRWFSIISRPSFAELFCARLNIFSPPPPPRWTLLFRYIESPHEIPASEMGTHMAFKAFSEFESNTFQLGFLPTGDSSPAKVLATSNGLLLCCANQAWHDLYFICNPLTAQWVALPKPPRVHRWVSLGFISHRNGSYQVVRIVEFENLSQVLNIETFSSETGEWRDSTVSCSMPVTFHMVKMAYPAVLHNGILHWLTDGKIIAYDPQLHKIQGNENYICNIYHSRPVDKRDNDRYVMYRVRGVFGASHGHLRYAECIVETLPDTRVWTHSIRVWMLRNYNAANSRARGELGEWCLDHKSKIQAHPLAFHPSEKDLLYVTFVPIRRSAIASYCLRTGTLNFVCPYHPRAAVTAAFAFTFVLPPWPTQVPPPTWDTEEEAAATT